MSSYVLYVLGALGLWGASEHSQRASSCDQLASVLAGKVFPPISATYNESVGSYFSFQEQNVRPACVVRPTDAQDVAAIVKTMARTYRESGERFAIRSHGHMLSAEAANIQDGVTVDLRSLHQVTVSQGRSTVRIGSGASWLQVYQTLDPLRITVAGGRDASIGAGGFLTGGGISAISPAVGWGCDEVVEYEIVLANGEITVVTEASHADLFVALKGGSNNFGVITHFRMKAHPYRQIWGGFTAYSGDEIPRQIQAYAEFMESKHFDPNANLVQSYGWTSAQPAVFVTDIILYAKPEPYPPVFRSLVNNETLLYSTLRRTNLSDFAIEEDSYQVPGLL
ncbi:FAD-binding oxidoreductase [Aspergillus melleus]|uniref:FAD-binding oxidoreductase n=1 Tax=Aspergillus melleus TaxID=138277 RepID=UPI001E8EDC8D|nr:uncharacterized protein LDX57_005004 [Aspergillus melleus]KAH8427290.1 hypothetical protein LDX57_005004 [Aspergillus melleus]